SVSSAPEDQQVRMYEGAVRVDAAMSKMNEAQKEIDKYQNKLTMDMDNSFTRIGDSFDRTVFRVLRGQGTWRMGFRKMGEEMLMDQIKHNTRSLAVFLADKAKELPFFQFIEEGKTRAAVAGNAQQSSSQTSTLTSGLSAQGTAAESSITTNAAVGASGAASSVAGIPFVGWVSFAEVGALALAEILAYKSMVSAAGGWDRVPYDGAHTILHQDEMVLPAQIANPMRHLAESGNMASGDTHMHISTMDSRSFGDFLKKNPHALTAAVKKASRMHLGV
ncbi:MAG: hypothetical protein ACRESO_04110, partial [Gammaproteobacteria bacterium]